MNKHIIITLLLALAAMTGQGQELKIDGQSQSQIKRVTASLEDVMDHMAYAFGQNCPNNTVVKQDTIVVLSDSICCKSDICESDTARHKKYLPLQEISAISQGQTTKDIDPNALKMPKFDPYKKKFTDMQLINSIGPLIKR